MSFAALKCHYCNGYLDPSDPYCKQGLDFCDSDCYAEYRENNRDDSLDEEEEDRD